jgi:hypothetical protein
MSKKRQFHSINKKMPKRLVLLNEFVAGCLEFGLQQLRAEGRAVGMVHLAYDIDSETEEPNIRQYELTRLDEEDEEQEFEQVREYARRSGAQAICLVMDLGMNSETSSLFPNYDGVLIAAAISADGEIGVLRPYKKSGGRIEPGEPKIAEGLDISLFEGIF